MNYTVKKNGESLQLCTCRILEKPYNKMSRMEYAHFFVSGETELEITSAADIESFIIRPQTLKLSCMKEQNTVRIILSGPCRFSLEINGSFSNNLMVFAEDEARRDFYPQSENMIEFEKGDHDIGTLKIDRDNTTVILHEGAFVEGRIEANNVKDLTICGFGRINMEKYTAEMRKNFAHCLEINNCTDVTVRDITVDDSNDWSIRVSGCDNVHIDSVKIFGCRGNSDGTDICGSRNVTVENVFTRVWDDSFVVKALDTGNCENILFKNSILWNDFARPMEVGVELRADKVRNIRFENIDIIHSTTGYPLMGLHHGDRAEVSNITFSDIRAEDVCGAQPFDVRIADSVWNRDTRMGNIHDITISDIAINDKSRYLPSRPRIEGFSAANDIENVTLRNITFNGLAANDAKTLGCNIYDFVKNVKILADKDIPVLTVIDAELTVEPAEYSEGTYKCGITLTLTNTSDKEEYADAALCVFPRNIAAEMKVSAALAAHETKKFIFSPELPPGKYAVAVTSEKRNILSQQAFMDLPLVLNAEKAGAYSFCNYYNMRLLNVSLSAENNILKLTSDRDVELTLYAAAFSETEEGEVLFSPEESDYGEVCALISHNGLPVEAPQLRCPLEITYVFKNEPKVDISEFSVKAKAGQTVEIPFAKLNIADGSEKFRLELEAHTEETKELRYPYTLFHSDMPKGTAHMFATAIIKK